MNAVWAVRPGSSTHGNGYIKVIEHRRAIGGGRVITYFGSEARVIGPLTSDMVVYCYDPHLVGGDQIWFAKSSKQFKEERGDRNPTIYIAGHIDASITVGRDGIPASEVELPDALGKRNSVRVLPGKCTIVNGTLVHNVRSVEVETVSRDLVTVTLCFDVTGDKK